MITNALPSLLSVFPRPSHSFLYLPVFILLLHYPLHSSSSSFNLPRATRPVRTNHASCDTPHPTLHHTPSPLLAEPILLTLYTIPHHPSSRNLLYLHCTDQLWIFTPMHGSSWYVLIHVYQRNAIMNMNIQIDTCVRGGGAVFQM